MSGRKPILSMPAPPPYLLEGRYLCESALARGEAADVFEGTDTWSGEQVAIRLLRRDRLDREDAFRRMSERLFGATSSRLVRAIALGDAPDSRPFLVTELLVGRTAESLGSVRWEVACEITRQAAAALAELAVLDLHHGSLTASKLFVASQSAGGSRVKLLDLGTGERGATARKDVRALGAILYGLLTGAPRLPDESGAALRLNVTGMPPRVGELVERWLSDDADEAIAPAEVAGELKFLVDASTQLAQPAGKGPRVVPRSSLIMMEDGDDDEP